jgi:hypothetical protein
VGVSEIDPNRLPGEDAEPLPADARMRWDAFKSAVGELAAATDDTAGLEAAVRAVQQIMRGLDAEQYTDALDVPEDAGEFADGLRGILMRIPDGWGRWISCERGWYPLLTELNGELAVLLPRYRIHQVKEKFAGLRFYWTVVSASWIRTTRSPASSGRLRARPRRRACSLTMRRGSVGSPRISKRARVERDRRIWIVGSSSLSVSSNAPQRSRRGHASAAASPVSAVSVATEPGTRRCAALVRMLLATNLCLTMTTTRSDRPLRRSGSRRSLTTMLDKPSWLPLRPPSGRKA